MFAPLSKVLEDPATGSASAALAGLLATLDPPRLATTPGQSPTSSATC
jgi:predicted PhzF superfamily epimerase YddE/YHI9